MAAGGHLARAETAQWHACNLRASHARASFSSLRWVFARGASSRFASIREFSLGDRLDRRVARRRRETRPGTTWRAQKEQDDRRGGRERDRWAEFARVKLATKTRGSFRNANDAFLERPRGVSREDRRPPKDVARAPTWKRLRDRGYERPEVEWS